MKKKAIIIHGCPEESEYRDPTRPSPSNDHWIPWLQKQLLLEGILSQALEMPTAYDPHYEDWKNTFEQLKIDENTDLIGHSCGGGFLVRWLSENNVKVGKVILVAPWLDPDKEIDPEFFDFEIDPNISDKTSGLVVMYSTDDFQGILTSVDVLKSRLKNVEFQEFTDKGHFVLDSMRTEEFPELLKILFNENN